MRAGLLGREGPPASLSPALGGPGLDCLTRCSIFANLGKDPGSAPWDWGPVNRVWGSMRVLEPGIPTCR